MTGTRNGRTRGGHVSLAKVGGVDHEILVQARQRLAQSSYQFLRSVDCCADDGVLTLRGRVPSFYLKQMAQSMLANLRGVRRIVNQVDVVSASGLSSVRQIA